MKKDHHYVPKLILRKFDERINTFDLTTGKVQISGLSLKNTFSDKFLYSQEIEDLFNKKIESEFSNILINKILSDKNEITLERREINLIKKFLLLAMIRTIDGNLFIKQRKRNERIDLKSLFNFEEKNVDGISDHDYWMRTIKCILESNDLSSVRYHRDATNQAVSWAYTFNCSYISIWDSTESNEDFIIIDNGMTSEHETTRFLDGIGNDVIKRGYLLDKTIFSKSKNCKRDNDQFSLYYNLLLPLDYFTENFYLFSISKNRMIALINPFFRLYDKNDYEPTRELPTPDIWATRIKDRSLFLKNKYEYINTVEETLNGNSNEKDLFIYSVKQMKLEDVIYVNCLSFDRIHNIVGFVDSKKIRRSLSVYSIVNGKNDYSKLIDYFLNIGNPIVINDLVKTIRDHISPSIIRFSDVEQRYIDHFLRMREMIGDIKK